MTKTEFEIAKVYEEQLLQILRVAEKIKSKLIKLCDEDGNEIDIY